MLKKILDVPAHKYLKYLCFAEDIFTWKFHICVNFRIKFIHFTEISGFVQSYFLQVDSDLAVNFH